MWIRARARLWPPGHALSKARVYDLRHAAATSVFVTCDLDRSRVALPASAKG